MAKSTPPACPKQQALIICRNKHWRYISAFHGPWLQLPPEILESLAHSNFQASRPFPIDPAVFYDLVKIRKAVDEATNLAVRATSGLTSAALGSQANAANGILGGAAHLGLAYVAGGQNTKLSRERKYRMRELATQKLSHAYHLDEIAASVATMQSASTLDDVAQFVLQRSPADPDAKYVHFFHEKIPSRMLAEYTPLDSLDHIISERPNDGSPLRTRALTRLFTEDYIGAARDLTDGLSIARYLQQQHGAGRDQLVLASSTRDEADARRANPREWRAQPVKEEDQPNSLETQLLFHRAGVYLSLACQYVSDSLDGLQDFEAQYKVQPDGFAGAEQPSPSPEAKEAHRKRLEHRKLVKTYAKRAVRDYLAFLSRFEYTPGISPAVAEGFLRKVNDAANGVKSSQLSYRKRVQELTDSDTEVNGQAPDALVKHQREIELNSHRNGTWSLPPPAIHPVSALFSSMPPADLPPYPQLPYTSSNPAMNAFAESQEAVTYHPLLTDALHSLLLCHALIQTPPTELRRHAYNVARIVRISDGYPIFLAARSPARADWSEILHRTKNWVELSQSWDQLCRPAPLPGSRSSNSNASSSSNGTGSSGGSTTELVQTTGTGTSAVEENREPEQATQQSRENGGHDNEHRMHEAILEALADERVVDEESFQRSIRAREQRRRQGHDEGMADNVNVKSSLSPPTSPLPQQQATEQPKRCTHDDVKGYTLLTERAEAVARWVREAPRSVGAGEGGGGKKRRGKKGGAAARKNGSSATATAATAATAGLEGGLRDLGRDTQGSQSGEGG